MKKAVASIVNFPRKNILLLGLVIGLVGFGLMAFRSQARSADSYPEDVKGGNVSGVSAPVAVSTPEVAPGSTFEQHGGRPGANDSGPISSADAVGNDPVASRPNSITAGTIYVAGNSGNQFLIAALNALGEPFVNVGVQADPSTLVAGDILIIGMDGGTPTYYDYTAKLDSGVDVIMVGGSNTDAHRTWASLYFTITDTGLGWHTDGNWNRLVNNTATQYVPATYTFANNLATYHMLGFLPAPNTVLVGGNGEPTNVAAIRSYNNGGTFNYLSIDPGEYGNATDQTSFTTPWMRGALEAARASACTPNVLLIEDQGGFGATAGILTTAGFNVTVVNNEFANGYANLLNGAYLSGFNLVVYGERGDGFGSVLPVAVAASLETYIQNGGNLLVTGYDTLGSPTDVNLAGLVRATGPGDQASGIPNWQTANVNNFILNGPYGDFRNLAFVGIGYDDDVLIPNLGAGAIELASTPGRSSKIIFTDLPGAAGSVGYWNGGVSGYGADAQPDFYSGGNPQNIFLNWVAGVGCPIACVPAPTTTFNYTGAMQTYTVPAGVTSISVDAMGAQGGGNAVADGGRGGRVTATLSVTPGQILNIFVGGQGDVTGTPGYNGGGSGIGGSALNPGSGGGGGSDIRIGGTAFTDRVIVAGGGGGGTENSGASIGGNGGGLVGANGNIGTNVWGCQNPTLPTGGTQSAGGLGGTSTDCMWNGFNGSLGIGGNSYNNFRSSGGGGGYYGGGGAHNGMSGAGGSSYTVPTATAVTHTQGFQTGNGVIVISSGCGGPPAATPTTTTVASTQNPSVFGQSVTFTATVSPNPGAGAPVDFVIDGGAPIATTTNASGVASTSPAALSVGTHTVVANFTGTPAFAASSGTLTPVQTVNKADTTTTITSDVPDPSVTGQGVVVSFTVAPVAPGAGTPTGNVVVTTTGGAETCTGTVASGTCTITFLTTGAKTLTATYAGDGNFNGSSGTAGHQVNKANTTTTITSDNPDPSVYGQTVVVNYTVAPTAPGAGTPTGNVVITVSGGAETCTGTAAAGTCSLALTTLGARTITATYAGDANFNGSNGTAAHQVNKSPTTTTITSDNPDPSLVGQPVVVNFTVAASGGGAGTPTGTVTVTTTGGAETCSGVLAGGSGTCTITFLTPGAKTLTATYPSDANFLGSSGTAAHTVNQANTTTTVTAVPASPSIFGQSVTFTATVAAAPPGAGTPTGTVTFNIDGNIYCPNTPLTNQGGFQRANCTQAGLPALPAGVRNVVAIYNGDANFNGSAGTLNYTVNKANTTTAIVSDDPDPSLVNQPYTVTWTVTAVAPGAGTPVGTVTVNGGAGGGTCTAPATSGGCQLTPTTIGTKTIQATFNGDANFNGSASATTTHTVNVGISGTVRNGLTLAPVPGVTMGLYQMPAGTFITSTTTNAAGLYTFAGNYTAPLAVQPTVLNPPYYDPQFRYIASLATNVTGQDFLQYGTIPDIPRTLSMVTQYVVPGAAGSMPFILNAQGNEASVSFSISYDINPLAQPPVFVCGADAPLCTITNNTSVLGRVGVTIVPAGGTFGTGLKEIARMNFQTVATPVIPSTPITFQSSPVAFSIVDAGNNPLLTVISSRSIVFAIGNEGDVAGRNSGSGTFEAADVVQMRRFVTGLDVPLVNTFNEFQRADTSPASTTGDGVLDATDLVQARRYVAGLDAARSAGGAGFPNPAPAPPPVMERVSEITIGKANATNNTRVSLPIDLAANGTETAASFAIRYDESRLDNPTVELAANAPEGITLTFNKETPGVIRVLIDSPNAIEAKAATLLNITFDVRANAPSGDALIEVEGLVFSDQEARATRTQATMGTISIAGPNPAVEDLGAKARDREQRAKNKVTLTDNDLIDHWLNRSTIVLKRPID